MIKTIAFVYLALVAIMSLITFAVYGWDKHQARNNGRRVPESRLHGLAFMGGWPGAMLGQHYFRHKTQKLRFKLVTWLAAVAHGLVLIGIVYFYFYF
jgi:uncharacterized membrane protein YsdA (DUF1294 family)